MNNNQQIEVFEWVCEQDSLRIETWHYMGGGKDVSVWLELDEETPSGKARTVLEALAMAKQSQEYEATR